MFDTIRAYGWLTRHGVMPADGGMLTQACTFVAATAILRGVEAHVAEDDARG